MVKYLLLLLTISCSTHYHAKVLNVSGFEKYVSEFDRVSYQAGNPVEIDDLYIHFDNLSESKPGEAGLCVTSDDTTPEISVDAHIWEHLYERERHALLFHEMAHCILFQKHRTDVKSLMNPYIPYDYDIYYDYYNSELFLFELPGYPTQVPNPSGPHVFE